MNDEVEIIRIDDRWIHMVIQGNEEVNPAVFAPKSNIKPATEANKKVQDETNDGPKPRPN